MRRNEYGYYGNGGGSYGGGRFGGQQERTPPVNEGDELDVRIEAVGEKGDGVAKKDGFVLFVPNVKEGDEVRIRVTKVLRKVGFAEVIGQPQGPVTQSSRPPARSEAEEKARERQDIVAQAEKMEDSEDFGEEPEESEDESAPVEDEPEDMPADEPEEKLAPVEDEPEPAEEPADADVDEEKKE